jgi:hypothetical protein
MILLDGTVDLTPPISDRTTPEQRLALWADLVDVCEQLLLAGLRREVGSEGDVWSAYRRWWAERSEEHDRGLYRLMEGFTRRGAGHAR